MCGRNPSLCFLTSHRTHSVHFYLPSPASFLTLAHWSGRPCHVVSCHVTHCGHPMQSRVSVSSSSPTQCPSSFSSLPHVMAIPYLVDVPPTAAADAAALPLAEMSETQRHSRPITWLFAMHSLIPNSISTPPAPPRTTIIVGLPIIGIPTMIVGRYALSIYV